MGSRTRLLVCLGIGLIGCGGSEDEEPPTPGTLYVSEGVSTAIHALDPGTGVLTPLTDLPIPSALDFVAAPLDPFLVINRGPLYRFDLRTRQLVEIVNGDRFHANFAVSESGTLLAYRNSEPTGLVLRVREIGTDHDVIIPGLDTWESIFALQWLGDTALVFLRGDVATLRPWRVRVNGSGLEPIGEPAGAPIRGLSVDPTFRFMALIRQPNFGGSGPVTLSIVTMTTLEERHLVTLESWPSSRMAWSPDGRLIAGVTRRAQQTQDVMLIDAGSGELRYVTTETLGEDFVTWSVE